MTKASGSSGAPPTVARRGRVAGAVVGSVAALLLVVVGCTRVSGGTAEVDTAEIAQYRTSVSESLVSSSSAESSRQAAAIAASVQDTCEALAGSSDTVAAVNAYVDAVNSGADTAEVAGPAIDSLNGIADRVEATVDGVLLPGEFLGATFAWIDATRELAGAVARGAVGDDYNGINQRFNDTLSTLRLDCA